MVAAPRDKDVQISTSPPYDTVATEWSRLTRSFARSLRAYQMVSRLQALRLQRTRLAASPTVQPPPTQPLPEPPCRSQESPRAGAQASRRGTRTHPLTRRQFEVAELIAAGFSNDQIARKLVLTPGTVGNHIGHILRRLGARNRAQVAAWVTQIGATTFRDHDDQDD